MEKLRFTFAVLAASDGKTNLICITSIETPDGCVYDVPDEKKNANKHTGITSLEVYAKIKNSLKKRHQTRKIWIPLTDQLRKIYLDAGENVQFDDQYLDEITQDTKSSNNNSKLDPEHKNFVKIADKFLLEKFSGRTSNVNQWIEEFETECERFEILQDESKIEILKHLLDKQCLDWYTDASLEGIGAILKQIQPNGKEKPVAYFSKKLNEAQKKKKAIYLECLAIKEAVKYWQYWLIGKHFTVYSDHKPLENMNIKSRIDEELGEFTYYLSQYDFKIKYAPGKDNLEADCLSRNPVLEAVDDTDEQLRIVNLIHYWFHSKIPSEGTEVSFLPEELKQSKTAEDWMIARKIAFENSVSASVTLCSTCNQPWSWSARPCAVLYFVYRQLQKTEVDVNAVRRNMK
ncbi:hypothetical protein EVAR_93865_1 [Eumeta japonica]|uniref:Reverse transcriptase RNase H-like domain-containing protein n=1 Tax=Eumeta variegata TaxID=151549 RepID=A0A4C1TWU8_EUMVA|nr:hypothetical protein EVAR_93865_1 [Eumeta japonica]